MNARLDSSIGGGLQSDAVMKKTGAAALSQSKVKDIKTTARLKFKRGSSETHSMAVSDIDHLSTFSDLDVLVEVTSPFISSISFSAISSI